MSQLSRLFNSIVADRRSSNGRQVVDLAERSRSREAYEAATTASKQTSLPWDKIAGAVKQNDHDGERLLRLALLHSPDSGIVLLALGQWLAAHGQLLGAFDCATNARDRLPYEPAPLVLIGQIQLALGNYRAASHAFLAAIRRDEGNRQALAGYRQLLGLGVLELPPQVVANDEEEKQMRNAIASAPDDPSTQLRLGKHYSLTSRCALALPFLENAHRLAPGDTEIIRWLAWTLIALDDHKSAMQVLEEVASDWESDLDLLKLASECAAVLKQNEQAIDLCRRYLAIAPSPAASVLNNLGDCLSKLEQFEDALVPLQQAVATEPTLLAARLNLGYTLNYLARYEESQAQFDALLALERNDFGARWYRATALLSKHQFREGWQDYEFRFASTAVEPRVVPLQRWQGQSLAGHKIVVTAEQGIGDEIMFASCLPDLIRQADHCVLECNRRLVALFQRSFPDVTVVEWLRGPNPPWLSQHSDATYYVPVGSLPLAFRPTKESFPADSKPYLVPAPERTQSFKAKLTALGDGLRIGFAWRGGGAASRTRTRSLALDQLAPLLTLPGCSYVSLQYGNCTDEVRQVERRWGVTLNHWSEVIADLDSFAALVAALDVVVTVCSAPVHFAGALGKPALVLTPFAPEWRYVDHSGRMLWYPSVRVIQQPRLHDWDTPIAQAIAELVALRDHKRVT